MGQFIVRRLLWGLVVVFLVSFISFLLVHLIPGDPVAAMLGMEARPEQIEALRHELWLDRPFLVQYCHWLANALRGELGTSIAYRDPITELIATRLPITFYLTLWSLIFSVLLGIALGILSAVKRGSAVDQLISVVANIGVAVPLFWLGILLAYVFGYKLGLLPIAGWTSPLEDPIRSLKQSIMPVIVLTYPSMALITRQTRSSMLEVLRQDYVRTALAKGLEHRAVLVKHALRNALIPVITLVALQVRLLVGGTVLVESVFNIPGMGRLLVTAALNKDFLVVQAGVLLIGIVVCLANLVTDIAYGWVDPRIRYE